MRGTREKTTQEVTITSWMTCAQYSFHGLIQTAVTDEVSSGLVGTRSVSVRDETRQHAFAFAVGDPGEELF